MYIEGQLLPSRIKKRKKIYVVHAKLSPLLSIRESVGDLQSLLGVADLGANQVVKGRGVGDTRGQVREIPEVAQGLEDRGRTVGRGLARGRVDTVVLDVALGGVGRDQPGRHTATEAVKSQGVVLTVGSSLSVSLLIRTDGSGRGDVVEETTRLVVGNQEKRLLPLRTGADGIVDLLQQNLAEGNVAARVHGVGVAGAAGWVDVGDLRKETKVSILVEVLQRDDAAVGVLGGPVEEHGVGQESTVGAVVVLPGDSLLGSNFEDASGSDLRFQEAIVVLTMAISSTGKSTQTIGVSGLF